MRACCTLRLFGWLLLFAVGRQHAALAEEVPSFREDIVPVLTRHGCNSGGCHGKLAGQNGFKLSLRGYAPELDYESIVQEARGRRINPAAPEYSLFLRKAWGTAPHGGGRRIEPGSPASETLTRWIAAGAPNSASAEPRVTGIVLEPPAATMTVNQQLTFRVLATYGDGRQRDVTGLTQFAAGDATVIEVSDGGSAVALRHGESVVRASFQGQVEISTLTVPHQNAIQAAWYAQRNNAIDQAVMDKLAALHIEPSPLCDDATFVRRAFLDAIGTLPTPEEAQRFVADSSLDKRSRLIDQLLARAEFVDYWALQLGDLLQNRRERDHDVRGPKGVRALHQWIREQLAADRGWNEIVAAILTAEGHADQNPAVGYYIVTVGEKSAEESELADSVAQALLGTRIGCARCHNHPLEKYTQDDYYHFASFLSRVALDRKPPEQEGTRLVVGTRNTLNIEREIQQQRVRLAEQQATNDAAKIAEAEKRLADLEKQQAMERLSPVNVRQPRTGQALPPRPLDRSAVEIAPGDDPRQALLTWMLAPHNQMFRGAMVNRLWKHFLGIGLVEPVDDLRATNPPSNRALWDLLNGEFALHQGRLKPMIRLIMNSRTYQLSSSTLPSNALDDRFYSHFFVRRLPAEVLLDAISQVTEVPDEFPGNPLGVRAIQVPDPGTESYFLNLFGRSPRTTACACERSGEVTLPQLLHLQNGDNLQRKFTAPEGRLARLMAVQPDNLAIAREIFLATLAREPNAEETARLGALFGEAPREEALVDILWATINSKDFVFNH